MKRARVFFINLFIILGILSCISYFFRTMKNKRKSVNKKEVTINTKLLLNQATAINDFEVRPVGDSLSSYFKLSKFNDEVVFLNLLASWCAPCRAELPSIIALKERLKTKNIRFVFASKEESKVIEKMAIGYPAIQADFFQYKTIPQVLHSKNIPATYVIYKGDMIYKHIGKANWNSEDGHQIFKALEKKASQVTGTIQE